MDDILKAEVFSKAVLRRREKKSFGELWEMKKLCLLKKKVFLRNKSDRGLRVTLPSSAYSPILLGGRAHTGLPLT
jgi:hypothetical protein